MQHIAHCRLSVRRTLSPFQFLVSVSSWRVGSSSRCQGKARLASRSLSAWMASCATPIGFARRTPRPEPFALPFPASNFTLVAFVLNGIRSAGDCVEVQRRGHARATRASSLSAMVAFPRASQKHSVRSNGRLLSQTIHR